MSSSAHSSRGGGAAAAHGGPQGGTVGSAATSSGSGKRAGVDYDIEYIGDYELHEPLGIGSFGTVRRGVHKPTGRDVAVKVLDLKLLRESGMDKKVEREISILKLLMHPHVIRLYEVIKTEQKLFLVMESATGKELFDYIVANGRLDEDEARRLFQEIVSGVEYCHSHMVVHRDIKPENLLLDENRHVKIADFGLSNIMRDGEFLKTSCGSPNYAAPEVISGNLYAGPEVDVWSCGVVLFALLAGRLPFDAENIVVLFRHIREGYFIMPNNISESARDLIVRMLTVDPLKRITIPDIKNHPWFAKDCPQYIAAPPDELLKRSREIDEDVLAESAKLANAEPAAVRAAVRDGQQNEMSVTYFLLLAEKQRRVAAEDSVRRKDERRQQMTSLLEQLMKLTEDMPELNRSVFVATLMDDMDGLRKIYREVIAEARRTGKMDALAQLELQESDFMDDNDDASSQSRSVPSAPGSLRAGSAANSAPASAGSAEGAASSSANRDDSFRRSDASSASSPRLHSSSAPVPVPQRPNAARERMAADMPGTLPDSLDSAAHSPGGPSSFVTLAHAIDDHAAPDSSGPTRSALEGAPQGADVRKGGSFPQSAHQKRAAARNGVAPGDGAGGDASSGSDTGAGPAVSSVMSTPAGYAWYLGLQTSTDIRGVMEEIVAMGQKLGMKWHFHTPYHVDMVRVLPDMGSSEQRLVRVKIQLFTVRSRHLLVDITRIDGGDVSFLDLCNDMARALYLAPVS